MPFAPDFENADLRKSPMNESPTGHLTYVRQPVPRMSSFDLPIGTQAKFIAAASAAANQKVPLNVLLTIRWSSLFCDNDVHPLRALPPPERIARLVESLRKWLARNGRPTFYIWVREAAGDGGEHWHFACSLSKRIMGAFAKFVAVQTREDVMRRRRKAPQLTEGEYACGQLQSWHLAGDTRPDRNGYYLAAYLGKGEPSQRLFRGKPRANDKKPVRGESYGGRFEDGKYDNPQGWIEGRTSRSDRFFIANELKRATKGAPKKPRVTAA